MTHRIAENSGMAALLAASALIACAPSLRAALPDSASTPDAAPPAVAAAQPRGEILRAIIDPSTGSRWLLVRNPTDPAAPARLVLADAAQTSSGLAPAQSPAHQPAQPLAIHAGDALIVEQHSAVVDAHFEAVALESAPAGADFAVRLKFGGKVVRVTVLAPGHAVLAPQSNTGIEAWR
jgi:hypothetical protein